MTDPCGKCIHRGTKRCAICARKYLDQYQEPKPVDHRRAMMAARVLAMAGVLTHTHIGGEAHED